MEAMHSGEAPSSAQPNIASNEGHLDVVRFLASEGADVNQARTTDGASPLYTASANGHLDMVRLLVSEGATVNQAATVDGASGSMA